MDVGAITEALLLKTTISFLQEVSLPLLETAGATDTLRRHLYLWQRPEIQAPLSQMKADITTVVVTAAASAVLRLKVAPRNRQRILEFEARLKDVAKAIEKLDHLLAPSFTTEEVLLRVPDSLLLLNKSSKSQRRSEDMQRLLVLLRAALLGVEAFQSDRAGADTSRSLPEAKEAPVASDEQEGMMALTFVLLLPTRKPNRTVRVSLQVEHWPGADQETWHALFTTGDLFDESGSGTHLSSRTRVSLANAYGRWLGFLSTAEPHALHEPLEARVTRERIIAFAQHLAETNIGRSVASQLRHLQGALRLMAPNEDWAWVLKIAKQIEAQAAHRSKRDRLRSDELYALGWQLMQDGEADYWERKHITKAAALTYRDGLMIALLAVAPMRRRNLASLTPGQNLVQVGQSWTVVLDADETKNHRALEYPLPQKLGAAIERYLAVFRPALFGSTQHAGLWASAKGVPLRGEAVYDAICRRTKAAFGRPVNPHLFRDGAATFWAQQAPAQVRAVSELLGHQPGMTERHYNQATGISAGRKLAEALSKMQITSHR
jgi:integrase